jgi:S1-C subfamily serine protease
MKTPLTFLLSLTFLFLFSGSVYGDDFRDGVDARGKGNFKKAYKLLLPLAEQGNAKAQNHMGLLYQNGQGVPVNYKVAAKWFRLAAEKGSSKAQGNLGWAYFVGKGVPQIYKEAFKWYRLAAEVGDFYGQFNLGLMYFNGKGIAKDYTLAHMWFNLCSTNGDMSNPCVWMRQDAEKKMSLSQIERAQQLVKNWKPNNRIKTAESPPTISPQAPKSKQSAIATGTGFLFGSRDYIVTNYHVVKGISQVKVKFLNEEVFDAAVIVKDIQNDVAILKLNKTPSLKTIEMKFGDSSRVRMGDKVFTIGYPSTQILGTKPKYSEGVISAVTGIQDNPNMFQTTVPILPGSSGSPLFNENGEVVGLTTGSLSSIASDLWVRFHITSIMQSNHLLLRI